MVVDRTIDMLIEMEQRLNESSTIEEAFPLYMAKRRFEEELRSVEAELNRLVKGWVWMPPLGVQSQGEQQPVATPVREVLQRDPRPSPRRPVPIS